MPDSIRTPEISTTIERMRAASLINEDGDDDSFIIEPASSDTILADLEEALGHVPADLSQVLRITSSIEASTVQLDFVPHRSPTDPKRFVNVEDNELLGKALRLGGDGAGNYWYLEPRGERSVVWWLSHDPPQLVRCADGLASFLSQRLEYAEACSHHASEESDEEPRDPDREPSYVEPMSASIAKSNHFADDAWSKTLETLPENAMVFDLGHDGTGIDLDAIPPGNLRRHGDRFVLHPHTRRQLAEQRASTSALLEQKTQEDLAWQDEVARRSRPWWKFW